MDKIKDEYETVYFAGDSRPDVEAASKAHLTFARYKLPGCLKKIGKDFIEFDWYKEIDTYMEENVWGVRTL